MLNVTVRADDVLNKLGSVFAPEAFIKSVVGQSGIENPPDHWLDICLDDEGVQERASAASYKNLRGDNPNNIADHWYSYRHADNWPLFCDFLNGMRSLSQLRDIALPPPEPDPPEESRKQS